MVLKEVNHPIITTVLKMSMLLSIIILHQSFGQQIKFVQDNFYSRFPQTTVNDIFQDPNGLLWLGTSSGLYSYDGINYHLITESKSKQISHIYANSENEILAGTEDGLLLKINNLQDHAQLIIIDSLVTSSITGVITLKDQMYVASYGDGLWKQGKNGWQKINGLSEFPLDELYAMAIDENNLIYLGTDDGLCIFDYNNNRFHWITVKDGLLDNIVKTLKTDDKGNIWIGFHQNGFCRIKDGRLSDEIPLKSWIYGPVSSINAQIDNKVLVGTTSGTIMEYQPDSKKINILQTMGSQTSNIKDIMVDREANLWISDANKGLSKSSLFFSFLDFPDELSSHNVQSIFMDSSHHLWFSTTEALYECTFINNKPEYKKRLSAKVYGSSFISIYAENDMIFIGTFGDGLLCYYPKTGTVINYREKHGLANNNILSIAANKETIWFATLGGVSEVQKKDIQGSKNHEFKFKNYHEEDGLGNEYIYQVFVDSKGRPWFATDGKGLTMLEDGKFTNFSTKDGLTSRVIYSITEDENGFIWVATPKDGIFRYDGQSFENYGEKYGLLNYQISAIHASKNSLFIIHKFGIDILKEDQLRSFSSTEGIGEINPDLNALTEDSEGNLWIGYQMGIIKINPKLHANMHPEILINNVLVNLNSIENPSKVVLSHDENYLTFNYQGFWYADPLKIKYEYKLDGLSQDWVNTKDHFVTFPNLPSGKYTFLVRASASDHFENASVAQFSFRIKAAYWETPWFYVLLIILLFSFFSSIIKIRERTLKKRSLLEREKIQFQFETLKSQINPHFLFNSFNTLISIIEEDPANATTYVEKLSDFFRNILQLREKDVITLKEELDLLQDYTFLQEKRFGKNIHVVIDIPEKYEQTQIPPLTIQLLAENAFKHNVISRERPLTLNIFIDRGCIVVQNNIHLKSKPVLSTNYGLENIIKRYQLLTKTPVEVLKDESNFKILLPIIY